MSVAAALLRCGDGVGAALQHVSAGEAWGRRGSGVKAAWGLQENRVRAGCCGVGAALEHCVREDGKFILMALLVPDNFQRLALEENQTRRQQALRRRDDAQRSLKISITFPVKEKFRNQGRGPNREKFIQIITDGGTLTRYSQDGFPGNKSVVYALFAQEQPVKRNTKTEKVAVKIALEGRKDALQHEYETLRNLERVKDVVKPWGTGLYHVDGHSVLALFYVQHGTVDKEALGLLNINNVRFIFFFAPQHLAPIARARRPTSEYSSWKFVL